jgi:aromatic ring-opening dioxygenase catalytic subunit (LigB family)
MFISHGGGPCFVFSEAEYPMFAGMDSTSPTADFLRALPSALPRTPDAIVVVSAHWETAAGTVGVLDAAESKRHSLLYDYYGFPEPAYHVDWAPVGHASVARKLRSLLAAAGFATPEAADTGSRGLDHGVFVPLSVAWPKADVPVVQVSLEASLDPLVHLRIGAAIAPLAHENILILGSGALTHNLAKMRQGLAAGPKPAAWATDFCEAMNDELTGSASALAKLADWSSLPGARTAHPREEHLLPLLVAAGAAAPGQVARLNGSAEALAAAAPPESRWSATRVHTAMASGMFSLDAFRFEPVTDL